MRLQDIINDTAEQVFCWSVEQYEVWNGLAAIHEDGTIEHHTLHGTLDFNAVITAVQDTVEQLKMMDALSGFGSYTLRDSWHTELVLCPIHHGEEKAILLLTPDFGQDGKVRDLHVIDRVIDEDGCTVLSFVEPEGDPPFLNASIRLDSELAEVMNRLLH